MNSVSIIGRVGQDPTRSTVSGKTVANFNIAVDEGYGDRKITHWIPIVAWDKTADLVHQYVSKGSQVAVEGRLSYRQWQDRDGNKRSTIEVVANRLDFLTRSETKKQARSQSEPEVLDDDIPF
jgi:single-strand DNA-binding protein